jgi:hypothetical protein
MSGPILYTIHHSQLPAGNPSTPEWDTYRREVGRLLAEGHEGKWVLIEGDTVSGIFEDARDAKEVGYRRHPLGGFLVHQIQTYEPVRRLRLRM